MEGPSLVLAREQLKPFVGETVLKVSGNATMDKGRFRGEVLKEIFTWGKHLILQFDGFALKVHFLLFGSYKARVNGVAVAGDYPTGRVPRLAFTFPHGELRMYSCSVKIMEGNSVKRTYDRSVDVLSRSWDPKQAMATLRRHSEEEIADVLLDQEVFAGVGNIIKNEVLSLARVNPRTRVGSLRPKKRQELVRLVRSFSLQFLRWRRAFQLTRKLKVHRKKWCPYCGGPITSEHTGRKHRRSHYCPVCQPAP